ncbi:hypothetical protein ACKGJO_00005 [Gracilimonas sp. Q87]|uniref:hypothetical protein n=1 Tax=Gracilimonas sp. Q87 TaxID=3384766 RepID=UPI003983F749
MARLKKRRSRSIETASFRSNALRNIDEDIDFGRGLTSDSYQNLVEEAQDELHRYNALLSNADKKRSYLRRLEKQLDDANERIFAGIITQFGRDSDEYEMMGGTRKSDIRNIRAITYEPNGFDDTAADDKGATTPKKKSL